MKNFFLFSFIAALVSATAIECPVLDCKPQDSTGPVRQDVCYIHDATQPTSKLKSYECGWYSRTGFTSVTGSSSCEFDLESNQYAWVSE